MARLTKTDIFTKYGIIFKDEKIQDPNGLFIRPLLKEGNTKVGKTTYTFSMPAGKDGTCVCDCEHCYAKEGRYKTSTVKECLAYNQYLVENYIDFVKRAVCAQIEADKIDLVRIHAAGDFATKNQSEYSQMWIDIVNMFPEVRFWTYTKVKECENIFDHSENANIVNSVLPLNLGLNFGNCKDLLAKYHALIAEGYKPHICACGTQYEKHCDECKGCNENKIVLFILHSCAGYNLKKDPYLNDILSIIKAQA